MMHKVYFVYGNDIYVNNNRFKTCNKSDQIKILKEVFEPTKDFWIGPALVSDYDYFVDKSLLSLVYGAWDNISDFSTISTDKEWIQELFRYIVFFFKEIDMTKEVEDEISKFVKFLNLKDVSYSEDDNPYHICCDLLNMTKDDNKVWAI